MPKWYANTAMTQRRETVVVGCCCNFSLWSVISKLGHCDQLKVITSANCRPRSDTPAFYYSYIFVFVFLTSAVIQRSILEALRTSLWSTPHRLAGVLLSVWKLKGIFVGFCLWVNRYAKSFLPYQIRGGVPCTTGEVVCNSPYASCTVYNTHMV